MAGEKAKGGKKGRKHGRNKRKPCAAAYLAAGHREKNHVSDVGRRVRQLKRRELAP